MLPNVLGFISPLLRGAGAGAGACACAGACAGAGAYLCGCHPLGVHDMTAEGHGIPLRKNDRLYKIIPC